MKKWFTKQDMEDARAIYDEHSRLITENEGDEQMKRMLLRSLVEKLSDVGTPVEDVS